MFLVMHMMNDTKYVIVRNPICMFITSCQYLLVGFLNCNVVTLNETRQYCNYMQEVEDRLPSELSGGMKKRVALARSIIFDNTNDAVEPEVCVIPCW